MSSIHRLAGHGDIYELHALLEAGADIDAVDDGGRTAFLDAIDLEMRRFLLEAGANPDLGRTAGMTLLALMAFFRDRDTVELLLRHGTDPDEKMRGGKTVREALDDPDFGWQRPFRESFDTPEFRARHAEAILKLSENLNVSPEEYVSRHRNILIFGYHAYAYDDPALAAWATRVSDLLASPRLREEVYRQHLTGEELDAALQQISRERRREERQLEREERLAKFEAEFLAEAST